MNSGGLFASCCGLFSRFERGGSHSFYVRVCPALDALGVPLVGLTYRAGPWEEA